MYMQSNQPYVMTPPKKQQSGGEAMMWGAAMGATTGGVGEAGLAYLRKGDLSKVDKFDTRVGSYLKELKGGMDTLDVHVAKGGANVQGLDKLGSRMNSLKGKNVAMRMGASIGLGATFGLLRNKSDGVI